MLILELDLLLFLNFLGMLFVFENLLFSFLLFLCSLFFAFKILLSLPQKILSLIPLDLVEPYFLVLSIIQLTLFPLLIFDFFSPGLLSFKLLLFFLLNLLSLQSSLFLLLSLLWLLSFACLLLFQTSVPLSSLGYGDWLIWDKWSSLVIEKIASIPLMILDTFVYNFHVYVAVFML